MIIRSCGVKVFHPSLMDLTRPPANGGGGYHTTGPVMRKACHKKISHKFRGNKKLGSGCTDVKLSVEHTLSKTINPALLGEYPSFLLTVGIDSWVQQRYSRMSPLLAVGTDRIYGPTGHQHAVPNPWTPRYWNRVLVTRRPVYPAWT